MPRDLGSLSPDEHAEVERSLRSALMLVADIDAGGFKAGYKAGWLTAHNWLRNELRAAVARAERNHAAG